IGLQASVAGVVAVQFDDGTFNSFPLVDAKTAGVQFFGFTDSNRAITHVTLLETEIAGSRDIYGVDDLRFLIQCSGELTASPLANQTLCVCETAMFATVVNSLEPVSFVWKANGQIIPGQTNSSLILPSLKPAHGGIYSVEISNGCKSLT